MTKPKRIEVDRVVERIEQGASMQLDASIPASKVFAIPKAEDRLELMLAVNTAISKGRNIAEIAKIVVNGVAHITGIPTVAFKGYEGTGMLVDTESESIRGAFTPTQRQEHAEHHKARIEVERKTGEVSGIREELRSGKEYVIVDDASSDSRITPGFDRILGFKSCMTFKITEDASHTITLYSSRKNAFTPAHAKIIEPIAAQVAIALRNAKTLDRMGDQLDTWRATAESMETGLVVLDPQGRILEWNLWMEEEFGSKKNDVYGQHFTDIFRTKFPGPIIEGADVVVKGRHLVSAPVWDVRIGDKRFDVTINPITHEGKRKGAVMLMHDRTEVYDDRDKLRELADKDGLTGLYNHRFFQEYLSREIEAARNGKYPISMLMLDIDHFKLYNDRNSKGHPGGDVVLKGIAKILTDFTAERIKAGKRGISARYGGEEMVFVCSDCSKEEMAGIAEQIRKEVEETKFPEEEMMPEKRLTVSIGYAELPADAKNRQELVNAADTALYKAKRRGRNRVIGASK